MTNRVPHAARAASAAANARVAVGATLQVGAVSGSSPTGNGFDAAVEKLRADAA